jgi:hypothetical protein
VFIIKYLNKQLEKEWLIQNPESTQSAFIKKLDFCTTVACCTAVGAVVINLLCLFGRQTINLQSLIVMVLIGILMFFSNSINLLVSPKGLVIGGHFYKKELIEAIYYQQKKIGCIYKVCLKEPIEGYDYITFYTKASEMPKMSEILTDYPLKDRQQL